MVKSSTSQPECEIIHAAYSVVLLVLLLHTTSHRQGKSNSAGSEKVLTDKSMNFLFIHFKLEMRIETFKTLL